MMAVEHAEVVDRQRSRAGVPWVALDGIGAVERCAAGLPVLF